MMAYRPAGDRDPEARWLLQAALARAPRVNSNIRAILRATDASRDLQERAFRVALADFSEGFCPAHGTRFEIMIEGGARRARCSTCRRLWGKPAEGWSDSEDAA